MLTHVAYYDVPEARAAPSKGEQLSIVANGGDGSGKADILTTSASAIMLSRLDRLRCLFENSRWFQGSPRYEESCFGDNDP